MILEDAIELSAMKARFRALVYDWDLGSAEVVALIHVADDALGLDLLPMEITEEAEHRMRLLIEIDRLLPGILRDGAAVSRVVREPVDDAVVDERGEPVLSLLSYMMGRRSALSALARALRSATPAGLATA